MNSTAVVLITGASSGIGAEFARLYAAQGSPLVLVARRGDRLEQLQQELGQTYGVSVWTLPLDLTAGEAISQIDRFFEENQLVPATLINNAGFGHLAPFAEMDWTIADQMQRLNILALTQLTHWALPGMLARQQGQILNVASIAGFVPGPLMAVYYATKAYVVSFTEAIAREVQDRGVTVTVLCPGPTRSEFQKVAKMDKIPNTWEKMNIPSSAAVAVFGYQALQQKKVVAIHGVGNRAIAALSRITPRRWLADAIYKFQAQMM